MVKIDMLPRCGYDGVKRRGESENHAMCWQAEENNYIMKALKSFRTKTCANSRPIGIDDSFKADGSDLRSV